MSWLTWVFDSIGCFCPGLQPLTHFLQNCIFFFRDNTKNSTLKDNPKLEEMLCYPVSTVMWYLLKFALIISPTWNDFKRFQLYLNKPLAKKEVVNNPGMKFLHFIIGFNSLYADAFACYAFFHHKGEQIHDKPTEHLHRTCSRHHDSWSIIHSSVFPFLEYTSDDTLTNVNIMVRSVAHTKLT